MKKAVVFIKGGFGNQLFQFAFANYLKEMSFKVKINTDLLSKNNQHTKRNLMFSNKISGFSEERYLNKQIFNLFLRLNTSSKFSTSFFEKYKYTKEVSQNLEDSKTTIYFNGYWKNISYPEISKKYILDMLKKFKVIDDKLKSKVESDRVLIHVRRRDFIKNNWDLDISYFEDSINLLKSKSENLVFDIFTDDFDWVSSQKIFNIADNIYGQTSKTLLPNEQDDFNETIDTFASMLNYHHYIVGNSSFAFWAAFLSTTESSIVTVPDPWFRNNTHPVLKKENWLTVSNTKI
tara:strand:- start:2199 stop:3071 length:873 start_codon:yes stop_codon:yes gene_type:complete